MTNSLYRSHLWMTAHSISAKDFCILLILRRCLKNIPSNFLYFGDCSTHLDSIASTVFSRLNFIPSREGVFHCINPFTQPHHAVNCHTVSARFVPGSIWTVFFGFALPCNTCVVIGKAHQSLALNRKQTADSRLCTDLRSNLSFFDHTVTPGRHTAVDAKCGRCFPGDITVVLVNAHRFLVCNRMNISGGLGVHHTAFRNAHSGTA